MNQSFFDRSTGQLGPRAFATIQTTRLVHAIQPCPQLLFNGGEREITASVRDGVIGSESSEPEGNKIWAHQAGTNALAIDIDGRLLVSGGADSSIKLWDLEQYPSGSKYTFVPMGAVTRSTATHKFGITHLSFYPFDSAAFISSSYDHHLKLYATENLKVSADFDLSSVIYTHALSPIASHLLVACATQNPAVRLVDLRSGSSTHSLAGHHGALLSVAWNPTREHILASGGIDGSVRLWDIRKSSGSLGVLDMEDSMGITGTDGLGKNARVRESGKSHGAAVNGICWTDNGSHLISTGHDNRIRVWDAGTGANTLASFGPVVKNGHLSALPLITSPTACTASGEELLFYSNENEILVYELHQGKLLKRLRVPGPNTAVVRSRTGERNVKNRITGLLWRGQVDGLYSAHTDGQIRAWLPRTLEDEFLDREEESGLKRGTNDENPERERKRQVLDNVYRDLTRQKLSFG